MNALFPKGQRVVLSARFSQIIFCGVFLANMLGLDTEYIQREVETVTVTNTVTLEKYFAVINGEVIPVDERGYPL